MAHDGLLEYLLFVLLDFIVIALSLIFSPRTPAFRPIQIIVLAVLVLLPILPYGVIETQTALFKSHILPATKEALDSTALSTDIHQIKILQMSPTRAIVYTVTPCLKAPDERGVTVELQRVGGKWCFVPGTDECIWSDSGSAHGTTFPPY